MKSFFNKLAKAFIGLGTGIMLFGKKMYALTPLYAPVMPEKQQEPTFWEKAGEGVKKILVNPIVVLLIVFIGLTVYLVKSKNDKRTKILIMFVTILIFCVILIPLYLLSKTI